MIYVHGMASCNGRHWMINLFVEKFMNNEKKNDKTTNNFTEKTNISVDSIRFDTHFVCFFCLISDACCFWLISVRLHFVRNFHSTRLMWTWAGAHSLQSIRALSWGMADAYGKHCVCVCYIAFSILLVLILVLVLALVWMRVI